MRRLRKGASRARSSLGRRKNVRAEGGETVSKIKRVHGREILNSRGFPTVEAEVELEDGAVGIASVPAGLSTGTYEAFDLRDGDVHRYLGRGVLKAVENINKSIAPKITGLNPAGQVELDSILIEIDGTLQKKRLGANAMLAVSLASARAAADSVKLPLWRYIGGIACRVMPTPLMNIVNGGVHANNNLNIQEFLIIPHGAHRFSDALQMGVETYQALRKIIMRIGRSTGIGDEGGFSSDFRDQEEVLDFIVRSIKDAGYEPGSQISIGLDIAATQFFKNGSYQFSRDGYKYTSSELIDIYELLCEKYPIISIEDGLAEDDWKGWVDLTARLSNRVQLIGDDLFVTHRERVQMGIERCAANAVLVKPNQIGTLTETLGVIDLARGGGYNVIVSHRSGETDDSFISDLAVSSGAGQIKAGAPKGMAGLAKYNRLLRIEEALGGRAEFAGLPCLAK
jgi:enolase